MGTKNNADMKESLFSSLKRGLVSTFIIIYTFFFIFSPRLVTFNTCHILFALAVFFCMFNIKKTVKLFRKAKVSFFFLIIFIAKSFSILTAYINGYEQDVYGLFQMCVELPVCLVFLLFLLDKYSYTSNDFINILIIVGIIQTFIGVAMLLSPSFKELVDSHRYQFWDDRYKGLSTYRMFGFAENLLHITPIVQAIVALLILIKSSKNIILVCLIPFFFLFCMMNTRTSVLVLFLIFALYLVFARNIKRRFFSFCFLAVIALVGMSSILYTLSSNSGESFEYFLSGYNYVMDVTSGGESISTHKDSFSSGYESIPSDIGALAFGVGTSIQSGIKLHGQIVAGDMGYINDIYRYGIILSLIIWFSFIKQAKNIKYANIEASSFLSHIFMIVFLISHFKGTVTNYNDFTVLLLLLSCAYILDKKQSICKNVLN